MAKGMGAPKMGKAPKVSPKMPKMAGMTPGGMGNMGGMGKQMPFSKGGKVKGKKK